MTCTHCQNALTKTPWASPADDRHWCEFCDKVLCGECVKSSDFGHVCAECLHKIEDGRIDEHGVEHSDFGFPLPFSYGKAKAVFTSSQNSDIIDPSHILSPELLMWTDELIERLKKYVESGRYFTVEYHGQRVYGIEPRNPEFHTSNRPDRQTYYAAEFYLSAYDDATPHRHDLEVAKPEDFHVFLRKPVEWQTQDPNWKEADPEVWAEHLKEQS